MSKILEKNKLMLQIYHISKAVVIYKPNTNKSFWTPILLKFQYFINYGIWLQKSSLFDPWSDTNSSYKVEIIINKGFAGYRRVAYKALANITFWMEPLLVARFMITIIPRHRELQEKNIFKVNHFMPLKQNSSKTIGIRHNLINIGS